MSPTHFPALPILLTLSADVPRAQEVRILHDRRYAAALCKAVRLDLRKCVAPSTSQNYYNPDADIAPSQNYESCWMCAPRHLHTPAAHLGTLTALHLRSQIDTTHIAVRNCLPPMFGARWLCWNSVLYVVQVVCHHVHGWSGKVLHGRRSREFDGIRGVECHRRRRCHAVGADVLHHLRKEVYVQGLFGTVPGTTRKRPSPIEVDRAWMHQHVINSYIYIYIHTLTPRAPWSNWCSTTQ